MAFFNGDFFDGDFFDPSFFGTDYDVPAGVGCWTVRPDGGRPTGPIATGVDYPFVEVDDGLVGVIADAYLSHADGAARLPLSLAWIYGLDRAVNCGASPPGVSSIGGELPTPAHAVDALVVDAAGRAVFDSTAAWFYKATPFGTRLLVHEWRTDSAVFRLVQHTAVALAGLAAPLPRTITPRRARLDERASALLPGRVSALVMPDGTRISTGVSLLGGYNVAFAVADPVAIGLRRVTDVTISATPGTGAGRAPGCNPEALAIGTIDEVAPDATGNFTLAADACNWVRPPAGRPATLQVGYDCKPCCECPDYEAVQLGILATWAVYKSGAGEAVQLAAEFQRSIDRWAAQKACRESQLVRINSVSSGGRVQHAISVCNTTADCLHDVTLSVDFAPTPARAATIDAGSTTQTDPFGYTYGPLLITVDGVTVFSWVLIPPGVSVAVGFSVIVAGGASTLTTRASARAGTSPIGVPATRTIPMRY